MNTKQQRDVVENNIGCLLKIIPVECVGIITKATLIQCKHINMKKTSSPSASQPDAIQIWLWHYKSTLSWLRSIPKKKQ